MKKKRYFPFGYRMTLGKLEIVTEEADLLNRIASHYLNGLSLLRLAEMANQSGLKYSDNANVWNKNMIARILDNERYWNNEQYPPIFSMELGKQILAMRNHKATAQWNMRFLQKKMVCGLCGAKLIRNRRNGPDTLWDCKNCTPIEI